MALSRYGEEAQWPLGYDRKEICRIRERSSQYHNRRGIAEDFESDRLWYSLGRWPLYAVFQH